MIDKSATERLREMLDECGISKVNVESIDGSYWGVRWFEGAANAEWRENDDHTELLVINATPEQAIAATLGGGECEWLLEHSGTLYDKWRCSKCGYLFVESRTDQGIKEDFNPSYCPNCGAKVVGA